MSRNPTGYRPPSAGYSKVELAAFAVLGIRDRVLAIERELTRIQRSFPDMLISNEPIVLLAPERRTDGKTWPLVAPDEKRSQAAKRAWTPARRKKQAAHARRINTTKARSNKPIWQQVVDVLLKAPQHQATSKELLQATSAQSFASIASCMDIHSDVIKRVKPGVYTLTAAGKNGAQA